MSPQNPVQLSGRAAISSPAAQPSPMVHLGSNKFLINGHRYSLVYTNDKTPVQFANTQANKTRIQAVTAIAQAIFQRGGNFPPQNTKTLTREHAIVRNAGIDEQTDYEESTTLNQATYSALQGKVSHITHGLPSLAELQRGGGGGGGDEQTIRLNDSTAPREQQQVIVPHRVAMNVIFNLLEGLEVRRPGPDGHPLDLHGQTELGDEERGGVNINGTTAVRTSADEDEAPFVKSGSEEGEGADLASLPREGQSSRLPDRLGDVRREREDVIRPVAEGTPEARPWWPPQQWQRMQATRAAAAQAKEKQIDADLERIRVLEAKFAPRDMQEQSRKLHERILIRMYFTIGMKHFNETKEHFAARFVRGELPRDHAYLQKVINQMERLNPTADERQ